MSNDNLELKIAERLSEVGAPCQFYEYVDEVAEFLRQRQQEQGVQP